MRLMPQAVRFQFSLTNAAHNYREAALFILISLILLSLISQLYIIAITHGAEI